jgi:hypothetical protein
MITEKEYYPEEVICKYERKKSKLSLEFIYKGNTDIYLIYNEKYKSHIKTLD